MSIKNLQINRATKDDAQLIAELGARTFEDSFGPDNQSQDMAEYLAANFSLSRIESELGDPASTFLLAYERSKVIGYVMLRLGKIPKSVADPNALELVRIYVEKNVIGSGYGSALMEACLAEAKRAGRETIWLGVWEKNTRAISFYKKWGFSVVGTQEFVLGSDAQNDLVMARGL